MTRREALAWLAQAAWKPPAGVPPAVGSIIAKTLAQPPGSLNTDWFGTLLVKGLLEWGRRGAPGALEFSRAWLDFHLKDERVAPFSGARNSRVVRAGGIPITTYSGHFGLSFPCYEIFRQFDDPRARRVCLDIASIILHQAARNRLGLVIHDDLADFTIPDVAYFVVTPLMIGAALDRERGWVYRDQAVFQLRTYIDTFLMKDTGLAKTILLKSGPGKSYWTRASGWLLWAITGVLRYMPAGDPQFAGFTADLAVLARGLARVQDASGGLHLFLDDPHSPLETSGTAMCAMGMHEAVRKGWLPASFSPFVDRAWAFVREHLGPDGSIRGVYTGWAVPAEEGRVEMDRVAMGWIPGFILSAANELSTA